MDISCQSIPNQVSIIQINDNRDTKGESLQVSRSSSHAHITNRYGESSRGTLQIRVMRQRVLCLGNADGQVSIALLCVGIDLLLGELAELNSSSAVHLLTNSLDALLDGALKAVGESELLGLLGGSDDSVGQVDSTDTTLGPVVGQDGVFGTSGNGFLADDFDFGVGVSGELVDGDDDGDAERLGVGNVFLEVDAAGAEDVDVLLSVDGVEGSAGSDGGTTTMDLEGADGGDDNDDVGNKAGSAALDVKETLTSHGKIETGLSDNESSLFLGVLVGLSTSKLQGKLVGNDGALTDGDVGEGSSVDEDGGTLKSLHQVGLDGILHQGSQGTTGTNIVASDGLTAARSSDDHAAETLTHVVQAGAEGQDGHTLRGNGNIETSFTGLATLSGRSTNSDATQMTVVDVENTSPSDGFGVNVQSCEAVNLFGSELVGVGLIDAKLLQATEHDRGELANAVLDRNQALV